MTSLLPVVAAAVPAAAVTPESPEVLAVVDRGLKFLESRTHDELGGKCLIALAFHKRGAPADHPKIQEALESCRQSVRAEEQISYNYSKCLAVIFLAELDSAAHRELIDVYAAQIRKHQKDHGGFGYFGSSTGDTSQTQYAALAYWSMLNGGLSPDSASVQTCLDWLMRTRDPSGVWGYQGLDPGSFKLITQPDKPGVSMAAAGMSGVMILGNMVGILRAPQEAALVESRREAASALRRVDDPRRKRRAPTLPAGSVDPQRVADTVAAGRAWYQKNFTFTVQEYQSYYFYSVERYMSFLEYLDGDAAQEPPWYNEGYQLLRKSQAADGSWNDTAGPECATAFSILFLLRSTQKSIAAALGEGTLVGGRGLPADLSKVRIQGGRLMVQHQPTEVDQLLGMLAEDDPEAFDALLDQPAALKVDKVGPEDARRLQQLVRSGPAGARLLAVRALAKLRTVDQAPTLIYALTDPDRRVVREARDGLRSISRHVEGFGPPDNFDEAQQREAVDRWKAWYRAVRPDAPPLP